MEHPITVEVTVKRPLAEVWRRYADPADVTQWNQASPDWHCPEARTDLRGGGSFSWRMAARDGSASFDFAGSYSAVREHEFIEAVLGDGRALRLEFSALPEGTRVVESFEAEGENSRELQRQGWLAILESFKRHCESQP